MSPLVCQHIAASRDWRIDALARWHIGAGRAEVSILVGVESGEFRESRSTLIDAIQFFIVTIGFLSNDQ